MRGYWGIEGSGIVTREENQRRKKVKAGPYAYIREEVFDEGYYIEP